MERYEKNGFCEYLKQYEKPHTFRFYDTTKSLLVVAKKQDNEPLMLIIDDRVSPEEEKRGLDSYEKEFGNTCFRMAKRAGLPLFWIRYVDHDIVSNSDWVMLWEEREGFRPIQMGQLVSVFHQHKIEASLIQKTPQKKKNDRLSSAFHIWQRECMNVGVFADVDLIQLDQNGAQAVSLIELKRSHYSMERWRPFAFDLNNFSILSNFCARLGGIPFYILYHEQVSSLPYGVPEDMLRYYVPVEKKGEPCYDKVDQLKVFLVEQKNDVYFYSLPYPVCLGTYQIDDWISKEQEKVGGVIGSYGR